MHLGRLLIERRGQRDEGCEMLRQAISLYHEMGMPREAQARAAARRLGCDVAEDGPDVLAQDDET